MAALKAANAAQAGVIPGWQAAAMAPTAAGKTRPPGHRAQPQPPG